MGRIVLGYAVFMLAFFLTLTLATSVGVALWAFVILHFVCAVGAVVCVWWEQSMVRLP